jgi:hypothetical protein
VLTRILQWTSLIALIGALFFWRPAGSYAIVLQFVVCGSAGVVAFQAAQSGRRLWAIAFAGVALLFNPLVAVSFSRGIFPWINVLCLTVFLASLKFLKIDPRLPVLSIADPGPRSRRQ